MAKKQQDIQEIAVTGIHLSRQIKELSASLENCKAALREHASKELKKLGETKLEIATPDGAVSIVLVRDKPKLKEGVNQALLTESLDTTTYNHLFHEEVKVVFDEEFEAALEHLEKGERKKVDKLVELVPCEPRVSFPK